MIASLRGIVAARSPSGVVIDVGGVGYLVQLSLSSLQALPPVGQQAQVEVHTHVREDTLALFGFAVPGEKAIFLHLCEISGIGPRMALTILSGISPQDLVAAVMGENAARLQKISGVGKRLAGRMIVELKDKLAKEGLSFPGSDAASPAPEPAGGVREDLTLALAGLGYSKGEIDAVLRRVLRDGERPVEELLRAALAELNPLKNAGRA